MLRSLVCILNNFVKVVVMALRLEEAPRSYAFGSSPPSQDKRPWENIRKEVSRLKHRSIVIGPHPTMIAFGHLLLTARNFIQAVHWALISSIDEYSVGFAG